MPSSIRFFDPEAEHGWLANYSPHPILLDGKWWPTVEHYFQAAKFASTNNALAEQIRSTLTPSEAKLLAKSNTSSKRQDWEQVRLTIMRRAIEAKFQQHPDLKELLLLTEFIPIVENAPDDPYWGIGDGTGLNVMGELLQELREKLTKSARGGQGHD